MRLENPEYLWLLCAIPALALAFFLARYRRRKQLAAAGDPELVRQLLPESSPARDALRFWLAMLTLACLTVALANPQVGTKQETVKRKGVDIVIALDLSNSMLSEDVRPNRLERSRQFISGLMDRMQNDRLGFIIFAGNAYLQMPLTIDYSAFDLYLKTVDTKIIPTQGTALGEAISLAEEAFDAGQKKHKALILISDGENHEEAAVDMAREAAKAGTKIFTVGVGTPKGGPIPVYDGYGRQVDFKKDRDGSIVLSRLNEKMLQEIAVNGNGKYYRLTGGREAVNAIMGEIAQMETKEIEEQVYTDYEDQFQFFLFAALGFLLLESLISARKQPRLNLPEWLKGASTKNESL